MDSDQDRNHFISTHLQTIDGRGSWSIASVAGDMSTRQYFRITADNGRSAILMQAPPDDHPDSLPGHKLSDYIEISERLRGADLSAPEIYAYDLSGGLILLEDFGGQTMAQQTQANPDLYNLACDSLQAMKDVQTEGLIPYRKSHVHRGRTRIIDWYIPAATGRQTNAEIRDEYLNVWKGIEGQFLPLPDTFLHIDFFPANLMFLPDRQGVKRCGILDFQGAMKGYAPYDLANLLEDARADMPADMRQQLLQSYLNKCDDPELSAAWYRILATQYHCRVIGQFVKLAIASDRNEYLQYLPTVHAHLKRGLSDPILKPMRDFLYDMVSFDDYLDVDIDQAKGLIQNDAF